MRGTQIPREGDEGTYWSCGEVNTNTQQVIQKHEIWFSYMNFAYVNGLHEQGKLKVLSEQRRENRGPALILGSGPSLEEALPLLKDWKGAIFCSSSHAGSCVYHGRDPDYILALDPRSLWREYSEAGEWKGRKTIMLAHPSNPPELFDGWPNEIYWFRLIEPTTYYYTDIMPVAYHFIKTYLVLFGCAAAGELQVANALGYDPLILVGCDFAAGRFRRHYIDFEAKPIFKRGKIQTRAGKWRREPPHKINIKKNKYYVYADNGVLTDKVQLYYKRAMMLVSRLDCTNILNTSTKGILGEFPALSIQDAIARQNMGYSDLYLSKQEKMDRAEIYLAKQRTFVVEYPDGQGIRFWETPDKPLQALGVYMARLENAGVKVDQDAHRARMRWVLEKIGKPAPEEPAKQEAQQVCQ